MKKELVYLACPYSHADYCVKLARFDAVNLAAAKLMKQGMYVFSPISHSHPIGEAGSLPGDWQFWEGYDRRIISHCDRLIVLKLPEWEKSTGVTAEIKIAIERGIPVNYMDQFTYEIHEQA